MKKIVLLSVVLCLLALPLMGLAGQVDLGRLVMSVPASLDVFTRGMRPDDPLLAIYATTADQVAEDLSSQGLLMKAREISGAFTVTLSSRSQDGPDFSSLADDALLAQADELNSGQLDTTPLLRSRQAAFLLLRGGSSLTALTRVNGSLYRLALKAEGQLTGSMADTLRQLAQSMDFGRGQ